MQINRGAKLPRSHGKTGFNEESKDLKGEEYKVECGWELHFPKF